MADRVVEPAATDVVRDEPRTDVDWEAAERSPEFKELVHERRKFVVPGTIFFLSWYLGFILLCGYAPDFMGEYIVDGFTIGYALAMTQFLMVWILGWMYLRKADRTFDPLARKAADRALEVARQTAGRAPVNGDGARVARAEEAPR